MNWLSSEPWKKLIAESAKIYQQLLSPYHAPACRFYPSCSQYLIDCMEQKTLFDGLALGVRRILRCHPFHPGGHDPVK